MRRHPPTHVLFNVTRVESNAQIVFNDYKLFLLATSI